MALPAARSPRSLAASAAATPARRSWLGPPRPARPPLTSCCSSARPRLLPPRARGRRARSTSACSCGRARARPCSPRGRSTPRATARAAAPNALDAHAGRASAAAFPLLVDSSAAAAVVPSDSRAIVDLCSVRARAGARGRPSLAPRRHGRRVAPWTGRAADHASKTSSTCSRAATCAACSPCRSRGRYPSAG